MTDRLVIAIAQLNPVVGDVPGNLALARRARAQAAAEGADLVVFSELFLVGYPPEDLVLKPALSARAMAATRAFAEETKDGGPAVLIGTPWREGEALFNTAAFLVDGKVAGLRHKYDLPNYGVFDEKRVFVPGNLAGPVAFRPEDSGIVRLGVMICEDMWSEEVAECLAETGADILISMNGSPFEDAKRDARIGHAVARVRETGMPLLYVNQVGGQDELVFDGASFVLNHDSTLAVHLPAWQEALVLTNWAYDPHKGWRCDKGEIVPVAENHEAVYQAMVLGLRDYVEKNKFSGVILGLSGGIDSALSAAVAVDALGADRVHGVMMPSRFTSVDSLEDAAESAALLGLKFDTVAIEPAVEAFGGMLEELFAGTEPNAAEENIQARVRGIVLMAISNKFGRMVLTTGNKSEMSVGYATLYGDMAGGFSVLKDVYKTDVYALSRWRNTHKPTGAKGPEGPIMPERTITKPPTAELRANQTDQDSLPPYDVLDDILKGLVEDERSVKDIVRCGHAVETVARVEKMLYVAEYKRRQAPPGVKVTRRNFGRDRRYPIINRFRTVE
ncbi:NAD+ synthase [Govanella unica]|uniref:Glutamine-dependent NAD(+) synthetase n=1 Tax=Govanella unica TaxID=2975056 RepID=A0A9X3TXM1_9PROT|nr:NAD+ synthase [Govania unica]MDA5193631.1 NAD+ synthase [Govania unica]